MDNPTIIPDWAGVLLVIWMAALLVWATYDTEDRR